MRAVRPGSGATGSCAGSRSTSSTSTRSAAASNRRTSGWIQLPPQVSRVRTAPLWTAEDDGAATGGGRGGGSPSTSGSWPRPCAPGTRLDALGIGGVGSGGSLGCWQLRGGGARTAGASALWRTVSAGALRARRTRPRTRADWSAALRSEAAVRALERACRAPGARRAARGARVPDLLAFADQLERALRPLSLDWYEDDGLGCGRPVPRHVRRLRRPARAAGPTLLRRAAAGHRVRRAAAGPLPARAAGRRAERPAGPGAARRLPRPAGRRGLPAGRRSSPPATRTPAAGRSGAAPTAPGLRTVYPGMEADRFADGGRERGAAATRTPSSGSAGSSPPRT